MSSHSAPATGLITRIRGLENTVLLRLAFAAGGAAATAGLAGVVALAIWR